VLQSVPVIENSLSLSGTVAALFADIFFLVYASILLITVLSGEMEAAQGLLRREVHHAGETCVLKNDDESR